MELLEYEFMRHALAAGILVSVACGVVGTIVVLNRIVFVSRARKAGEGRGQEAHKHFLWTRKSTSK